MADLEQCPRCGLAAAWRGDASGKCVKCYWPDAQALVTPDPRDAEIARLKAEVERHLRCTSSYPEKQAACARKDDEIARLKAEVSEARRHAVGVMAAGFNRALDDAGAPAAESPGLRIYAMRAEIARLKRALAAGPAALRAAHPHLAGMVEAVQEAALKEEP